MLCSTLMAVTVNNVVGAFDGTLKIGDTNYPNKEIYILPGVENNTVTFVLPDFSFNDASLGDIVLVNIPMNTSGQLTLENSPLYIRALETHVAVSMTSGSVLSATKAKVVLSIDVEGMDAIPVSFSGTPNTKNYDFENGGFEGSWSNNEPAEWHSFGSATGGMASFVTGNTDQFTRSTDKRPGSTGSQSAVIKSKSIFGVKANGNCTNGRIFAGSMTASDGSKNYNFSEPSTNNTYNTPFAGQPDSMVFWAKYIPADGNPSNSNNKARAHAVITTNAKYQDPEAGNNYSSVKIADAEINYSATSTKGWQRISVPFKYYSVDPTTAAYMLMTFTTNATPGGGTTSGSSVDNIYLDDVEMVYNYRLSSLTMNGTTVSFSNGNASSDAQFSDSEYLFTAKTNGKASKSFIGYDATNYRVYVYVVANNFAQAKNYNLYTLQMAEPVVKPGDTQYTYSATTCGNEPYSDELFSNLTQEGVYTKTIPNVAGGDSVITLTLSVLPTYLINEEISTAESEVEWRGKHISGLEYSDKPYIFYDSLKTVQGCDSIYRLSLYYTSVPRTYGEYKARVCEGDSIEFNGVYYSSAFTGDIVLSQPNQYGGDSVVHLTIETAPHYQTEEYMTIHQGEEKTWAGFDLSKMDPGMLTLKTQYVSADECDSICILHLTVLSTSKPWSKGTDTYTVRELCGRYEGELVIDGAIYDDKEVYVLPGVVDSTVTFVLPDFTYNAGKLGHIVIPNIEVTAFGQLLLEHRALYMDTISERATVTMINGLKEGREDYYSLLSPEHAQVVLYIEAPSLPQGILVFFRGIADREKNYDVVNGGFEGTWSNNEPAGWHSFGTATGDMADFVKNNVQQFVPSAEVRPWSNGKQSALISSKKILEVAANGNCTNGQINAGTIKAAEASKNYNFSDPANEGFNTPFHGRPDSIVFWAKYLPADRNAKNEVNKARMSTIITTDAHYQDPEDGDYYADVKIAKAEVNYAASADMGWQRLSAPFRYNEATAESKPAYVLTTFTTNMLQGGGSSYTDTLAHCNVVDSVYLDDVQMIYNKNLTMLVRNEEPVGYKDGVFEVEETYCDSCDLYSAMTNGISTQTFFAFDEEHRCVFVYVIADDYSRSIDYSLYRVEFSDSDTEGLIQPTEAIENITLRGEQFEKVLYNGELYIRCGEVWFNASGARVK